MTDTTPTAGYPAASSPIRTLAVRITDDLRAQLDVIAQLNDRTRAMRNYLAHDYANTDYRIVWNALEREIPALAERMGLR